MGKGREEGKHTWDILIHYLTTAAWAFALCSVELTPWAVIDWAASTSAFEDMGETYPPGLPQVFKWPWTSIEERGSWKNGCYLFLRIKYSAKLYLNQKGHLKQGSPAGHLFTLGFY